MALANCNIAILYVKYCIRIVFIFYLAFVLSVSGTISGNTITVDYNVSQSSICTCQLDSAAPVACKTL